MKITSASQLSLVRYDCAQLMKEMLKRGIEIELLNINEDAWIASFAGREVHFLDVNPSSVSATARQYFMNKGTTKKILQRWGYRVPRGQVFTIEEKPSALAYAQQVGFPLVVKPVRGIQGQGGAIGIATREEFTQALEKIYAGDLKWGPALVEEYVGGNEYRLFMMKNGNFAALAYELAHVVGDGVKTVGELIRIENGRRHYFPEKYYAPIKVDAECQRVLSRQGLSFDSVPDANQYVLLRGNANLSSGSMARDVTHLVHLDFLTMAQDILKKSQGLMCMGMDIKCEDIARAQNEQKYHIIEINPHPSIAIHMQPKQGQAHDIAGWLVDEIFPETASWQQQNTIQRAV